MRTAIAVLLSSFVVFAASAVAQEVTVDAGANVGESGEDTQSSTNLPTLDLEAGMAESQPQPQAGPQGPAGESGHDGTPGQNGRNGANGRSGRNGRNGRDGQDGRPGRDADLKEVSKLVQAGDAKVERVAKTYTDQRVGNERSQRIRADAKKKEAKKKVEHIGVWVVAALLGVIVGCLIRGRNASTARRSGDSSVNAANQPDHVRRTGDALGIPDFPRMASGPVSELVMEWIDPETGEQRRYRRATTDPPTTVAGYPDARGAIPGGGNAVAFAVSGVPAEEKEDGKPPFPPRKEKKMPADIPLEEVLADTKPGLPPTDEVRDSAKSEPKPKSAPTPRGRILFSPNCRILTKPGQIIVRLQGHDSRLGTVKVAYWLADHGQKPTFADVPVEGVAAVIEVSPGEDYYVAVACPGAGTDVNNAGEWTTPRRICVPSLKKSVDPTSTGTPTKECVIETKSSEVAAAIAGAKPTKTPAAEESAEKPAEAEAEEV